jgi:hypothetical protein
MEFSHAGTGRELSLVGDGRVERSAYATVQARPDATYVLQLEARSNLQSGRFKAYLVCNSAAGTVVRTGPDAAGASTPNDGVWHTITVGVLCPIDSPQLIIALHNPGLGSVTFRNARLLEVSPTP